MIMVMIVITVLIIIGMVLYFRLSGSGIEKEQERISEDKAAIILATIAQLPEVECSYLGGRASKSCVDTLKLLSLSIKDQANDVQHRKHYADLLGYMTITFEQLYPEAEEKDCTATVFSSVEYPETLPAKMSCSRWTIYSNPKKGAEPTFRTMPIALYYPTDGVYTFGQLKIYVY